MARSPIATALLLLACTACRQETPDSVAETDTGPDYWETYDPWPDRPYGTVVWTTFGGFISCPETLGNHVFHEKNPPGGGLISRASADGNIEWDLQCEPGPEETWWDCAAKSIVAYDDTVYFLSFASHLHAHDALTGERRWTSDATVSASQRPISYRDSLWASSRIDKATGIVKGKLPSDDDICGKGAQWGPLLDGNTMILQTDCTPFDSSTYEEPDEIPAVVAWDLDSDTLRWADHEFGWLDRHDVIVDGNLIRPRGWGSGPGDEVLEATSLLTGKVAWSVEYSPWGPEDEVHFNDFLGTDGSSVFVISAAWPATPRLVAVDGTNGDVLWEVPCPTDLGTVTFHEGTVYVTGAGLYAFDAKDGSRLWSVVRDHPDSEPPHAIQQTWECAPAFTEDGSIIVKGPETLLAIRPPDGGE